MQLNVAQGLWQSYQTHCCHYSCTSTLDNILKGWKNCFHEYITRLLDYIKFPGNIQLKRLKGHRSNSSRPHELGYCKLLTALHLWDVPKMVCFWGLRALLSSLIITQNFQHGLRAIQVLVAPRWLPTLGSTSQLQTAEKPDFVFSKRKIRLAVFLNKVQTLLLSKNLNTKILFPCHFK